MPFWVKTGAGKSTLMKVVYDFIVAMEGRFSFDSICRYPKTPGCDGLGIGTVHHISC